jgi:uncharacterized protein YjcR
VGKPNRKESSQALTLHFINLSSTKQYNKTHQKIIGLTEYFLHNMKLRQKMQQMKKAREMYLMGSSKLEISQKLKIRRQTIISWAHINQWEEERQRIDKEVQQKAHSEIVEEKARSLLLLKALEAKFSKILQTDELKMSVNDFVQVQKVKWEILTPRTVSQYNFLKQENVVDNSKTFKFVVDKKEDVQ